jgi:hypothetical protein
MAYGPGHKKYEAGHRKREAGEKCKYKEDEINAERQPSKKKKDTAMVTE